MKDQIIQNAAELFLSLGFKSVTMDEIANQMGISKKTIYSHFPTKSCLVLASTLHILKNISCGIDTIKDKNMDPIAELFEIKKFAMNNLKDEKSSPQFQLKKYFPEVFEKVQRNHLQIMEGSVRTNLEKGIRDGLYRANIPLDFTSKIYFVGMMGIKDDYHFPRNKFSSHELIESFLEYHLRAIVTPEGLKTLNKFIKTEAV